MHLTAFLLRKQLPMRRLTSGKHRIPRVVKPFQKREILDRLAAEEENLFYLRQPYVTSAQEAILKMMAQEKEASQAEYLKLSKIKMRDDIRFEDRLEHLRTGEAWE